MRTREIKSRLGRAGRESAPEELLALFLSLTEEE